MSRARTLADLWKPENSADPYATSIDIRAVATSALVERTSYGNGTDIGPLIADAGAALRSRSNTGRGKILVPAGKWRVAGPVDDDKIAGHFIEGAGAQATQLFYDYTGGVMFRFDGENSSAGWSGGGISRMRLILGAASLGGGSPQAIVGAGVQASGVWGEPDAFEIRNVYINAENSATARWYNGCFFDGSDRTSPPGIRVVVIEDLQVFDCSNLAIYLRSLIQASIVNIGSYTGSGTGNDVQIVGTSGVHGTQISVMGLVCSGTLTLANLDDLMIQGKCAGLSIGSVDTAWGFLNNSGSTAGSFGGSSSVTII